MREDTSAIRIAYFDLSLVAKLLLLKTLFFFSANPQLMQIMSSIWPWWWSVV